MKIHKIIAIAFFIIIFVIGITLFIYINTNFRNTFSVKVYDANTKKPIPYATVIFSSSAGLSGGCGISNYFTANIEGEVYFKSFKGFCANEAYAPGYKRTGVKNVVSYEIYLQTDSNSSFSKAE